MAATSSGWLSLVGAALLLATFGCMEASGQSIPPNPPAPLDLPPLPPDLAPLPSVSPPAGTQAGADDPGRAQTPAIRFRSSGVTPTSSRTPAKQSQTQRALNNTPGRGGVTLPRAAEVSGTTSQEAKPTARSDTTVLMRYLGIEDGPVKIYGWLENSYTGNTNGLPRDRSNFSVFPNRLANSWQGNQYYFVLEHAIDPSLDYVNLGFRLDTLFGNDWQFSKSYGLFDRAFPNNHFAGVDLPQLYGSIHLPILTKWGVDIQGGRFYSPAGFESVQAVKRPLLSVPYLFNYTPFTLFGFISTLHLNERINIYNGAVNGWDRWIDANYRYSYVGGINVSSRDGDTTLSSIVITGPDQLPKFAPANSPFLPTGVVTNSVIQGQPNPHYASSNRTYLSTVLTHNWSPKFTEAAEVFFVHENNVEGLGPGGPTHVNKESAWYGASHWYLYQFSPKLTGVYRAEIFRDQNGAATGVADNFYEQTIGLVYKPKPWIWFRPEARYDWAQFHTPFNDGTRGSQLTLAFDIILQF